MKWNQGSCEEFRRKLADFWHINVNNITEDSQELFNAWAEANEKFGLCVNTLKESLESFNFSDKILEKININILNKKN